MLTETVDTSKQKLDECKEVLKTNENGMCELVICSIMSKTDSVILG